MTGRLPARGFWSYARKDDDYSDRRVSQLYDKVRKEVVLDYGKPVEIFQDTSDITTGAVWEARIRNAIASSAFLIPVITPTFLQRPWCFLEVSLFLEREKKLQARHPELRQESLIFPIGYREIRDEEALDPDLMAMLRGRQWVKLEELLDLDLQDPEIRREIRKLVSGISKLLRIPVEAEEERGVPAADAAAPGAPPSPGEADMAAIPEPIRDEAALREAGENEETRAATGRRPMGGARRSGLGSAMTERLERLWTRLSRIQSRGYGPWSVVFGAAIALGLGLLLVVYVGGQFGQPATIVEPSAPHSAPESAPIAQPQNTARPAEPSLPTEGPHPAPVSGAQTGAAGESSGRDQTGAGRLLETQELSRRREGSSVARSGRDIPMGAGAGVVPESPTIQLGAFSSEAMANNVWRALAGRFRYLAPLTHWVGSGSIGSRTVYRLFASGADARSVCNRLRAAGETCIPQD